MDNSAGISNKNRACNIHRRFGACKGDVDRITAQRGLVSFVVLLTSAAHEFGFVDLSAFGVFSNLFSFIISQSLKVSRCEVILLVVAFGIRDGRNRTGID